MFRFLLAGMTTVAGVVLLFVVSFGDANGVWRQVAQMHVLRWEAPKTAGQHVVASSARPPAARHSDADAGQAALRARADGVRQQIRQAAATASLSGTKVSSIPDVQQQQQALKARIQALQRQLQQAGQSVADMHQQPGAQRQKLEHLEHQHDTDSAQLARLKTEQEAAARAADHALEQRAEAAAALQLARAQQQAAANRAKAGQAAEQQTGRKTQQAVAEPIRQRASSQPSGAGTAPDAGLQAHPQSPARPQSPAQPVAEPASSALPPPPPPPPSPPVDTALASPKPPATRSAPPPRRQAEATTARQQMAYGDPSSIGAVLRRLRGETGAQQAQPLQPDREVASPPPASAVQSPPPARPPPPPPSPNWDRRLVRARGAILSGKMEQAQQLLQAAQLQLVFRPVSPDGESDPANSHAAAADVAEALTLLGQGRGDLAIRYIDRARVETGGRREQASLPPPRSGAWRTGRDGWYGGPPPGRFERY